MKELSKVVVGDGGEGSSMWRTKRRGARSNMGDEAYLKGFAMQLRIRDGVQTEQGSVSN
jgi:hypothetical protein